MAKNQTLQHKRTTTPGNRPTASQVATGELAINLADRSIYTKDASNNIIELERDIIRSATQPTATEGTLWWNTTLDEYKVFDGINWVNLAYTGKQVVPANTTSTAALTGSGTSGSPYVITVNSTSGATQLITTITVTGLSPNQLVPIIDNNAATNGGRFRITNNIANASGTLVFNIVFVDQPASTGSVTRTANLVIGAASVYLTVNAVITAVFPQSINPPTNTVATTTSWTAANNTLSSTGSLQISLDGVTYGTGPLSITTGATLYTRWAGAAGSGTGIDGAHGTTITGNVVSSNGATSPASLTIDKTPAAFTFTDVTGAALNSTVTSNTVTITGVNSYVYLTSANTMSAAVGGGSFTTVPASGTSLFAISGQTLQVSQTSSSSPNTTTAVTITAGGTSAPFSVTTANNAVNTPSITTPTAGATGISPTATIVASAYAVTGTVGTHLNSDWQIYSNAGLTTLVTSSMASTTNLTTWTPSGLSGLTQYWVRVRYRSSDGLVSDWSPSRNWTTAALPGLVWVNRSPSSLEFLQGIVYDSGQYVAVGRNGLILTSVDGVAWNNRSIVINEDFMCVTYGAGLFVAAIDNGVVYTSPDGDTWTSRSTLANNSLNAIAYGAGRFVAVGTAGKYSTSTNGTSWSSGSVPGVSPGSLRGVAYGAGLFVAVGNGIHTSTDGSSWTSVTAPSGTPDLNAITYGNGQFVAVGTTATDGNSVVLTSPDGNNWTRGSSGSTREKFGITYGLGQYIAVGSFSATDISTNAITWTNVFADSSIYPLLRAVAYGSNQYVAVGSGGGFGVILSSP